MNRINRDFREKVFPLGDTERRERDTAAIRNVAGRLRELLGETDVLPRSVAKELGMALDAALAAVARREDDHAA
jgi:ribosomal protein S7